MCSHRFGGSLQSWTNASRAIAICAGLTICNDACRLRSEQRSLVRCLVPLPFPAAKVQNNPDSDERRADFASPEKASLIASLYTAIRSGIIGNDMETPHHTESTQPLE